MRLIRMEGFHSFINEKTVAVIHFDAEWNVGYRPRVRQKMEQAAAVLGDKANFAEVDIDDQGQLAEVIGVKNVPTVAYFRAGKLVAALIGANQDVKARTDRVLRGESIGYQDGTSAA